MKTVKFDVILRGQDYSPIGNIEVDFIGLYDNNNKRLLEKYFKGIDNKIVIDNKIRLLDCLSKDNLEKYIVGKSDNNKENDSKKRLYDKNFNGGYFAGVVGVLYEKIILDKSFFYDESLNSLFDDNEKHELNSLFDDNKKLEFNIRLEIHSRMDWEDNKSAKPYFLSTLLFNDIFELNDNMVPNNEDEIIDYLLLFWYKNQLQKAILKGFYKTYRTFHNNDDRLKGCIDVARHIRNNLGQNNGKIAYTYRENTVNNFLNHLIVAAYKYLKKKYYHLVVENFDKNRELKSVIDKLEIEIGYSQVNSYNIISKNLKPISHPFYTEYEELRKICMKILRNEGITFFDGNTENESKGILFYLPDLWEKYLESKIKFNDEDEVYVKCQNEIKIFGSYNNNYGQNTRPDYIFYKKDKDIPFFVIDAKFKPKWKYIISGKNKISYLLSDYDKCIRDMVSINSYGTGVIFPCKDDTDNLRNYNKENIIHSISKYNKISRFYTIPVFVPPSSKEETYIKWKEKFDKDIDLRINILKEITLNEKDFYDECQDSKVSELNEKRKYFDKKLKEKIGDNQG